MSDPEDFAHWTLTTAGVEVFEELFECWEAAAAADTDTPKAVFAWLKAQRQKLAVMRERLNAPLSS
jgi:hypothetical protein